MVFKIGIIGSPIILAANIAAIFLFIFILNPVLTVLFFSSTEVAFLNLSLRLSNDFF